MEMIKQPNRREQKCNDQNQKKNPSLACLLPQRPARPGGYTTAIAFIMQGQRNIQTAAALARAHQQFLALALFNFFRDAGRVIDHSLQFFHLVAQLGFLPRQVLFRLIERGVRSNRATKHAASPIE